MKISSIDNGDRLSELPQNITDAILSRFTTKQAIKNTSLLSKRWRHAWTTCPKLVLKRQEFASNHNFIKFVNRTLEIRGKSPLTTFQLYWSNVDLGCTSTWLHYAMRQRVQEIVMHVDISAPSSSEQDQWLSLCFLNLPNSINLTNLRCLHLRYVQCSNMLLEKLISSCTLLESLELSTHFESINITAPNLKKLHLNYTHGPVQISAPKLESMVCNLYSFAEISPTEDFKFLVDADVLYYKNIKEINKNKLVEFLKSLYNAKVLTLKEHVIKVLSELDLTKQIFPVFYNLKQLGIDAALVDTKNISVIVMLLRSCPSLEKLVLHNNGEGPWNVSEDYEAPWQLGDECNLSSLKDIVIGGFYGKEAEFQFVKFLLEEANTLCVMNINSIFRPSGHCKVISKELLAFWRASSHAKVVINKDFWKENIFNDVTH